MTVLVTAASGKVGREVVAQLEARDVDVRPATRRSTIPLDWTDATSWPNALDGVDRIFLVVPGGDDGHRSVTGLGPRVCEFLDLAASTGVSRVVLMTALGMDFAPPEVEQRAVEIHLQAGGPAWTILRPNWFFQNLRHGPLQVLAEAGDGVLRLPAGDAAVSFIDTRDIAAVAVEALLGTGKGEEYALTGPASLTFTEVAQACRDSRLPLHAYEPVSDARFRQNAAELGWHPDYVDSLSGLFRSIAAGHASAITDDIAQVTGRRPRALTDFVREIG
ncbi:NAD(P)H-binding protein [Actinomadura sp. 9N215]|uniref:NAD(P)H-binding protein n=1 Tax=Actinomadura sp. 9N215 TaxID=3375150 RepID=UPI0037BC9FF4